MAIQYLDKEGLDKFWEVCKAKMDAKDDVVKNYAIGIGDRVAVNESSITSIRSSLTTVTGVANQALELANGLVRAVTFATFSDLVNYLSNLDNSYLKVGDVLYIEALDTPDYWIKAVDTSNNTTNASANKYGYYSISELEGRKIDLTDYQKKTDNSLDTTAKTVVGAINEVLGRADNNGGLINQLSSKITSMNNSLSNYQTRITNLEDWKNGEGAHEIIPYTYIESLA